MVHGTRSALRDLPSVQIRFGNSMISESLIVKNLGVTMDRFLSFELHINQLVAKCTGVLVSLIHSKHVLPSYTVAHVVNALVVSSIRYCISIYGTCGKTQLHRVQKLLNFCARVISGRRKFQHVADVLQQLQWLRAEQLVNYHRLCLAKNSLDTGLPADIAAMFTFAVTPYNTRQTGLLSHPRAKTCSGQRRLSHCSQQFNQLPPVMKGLTRHTFKKKLKQLLLRETTGVWHPGLLCLFMSECMYLCECVCVYHSSTPCFSIWRGHRIATVLWKCSESIHEHEHEHETCFWCDFRDRAQRFPWQRNWRRTCVCAVTQPPIFVNLVTFGYLATRQILAQSVNRFLIYGDKVCTCARAEVPNQRLA